MKVREKVEKSRNLVFFQCFVAPEGRKVGSLKRRVRSKFGSQNVKSTAGSEHLWKLRCWRCGTNHISKSECAKHTRFEALLTVEMVKSARRCGAKHMSKPKCWKHDMPGPLRRRKMHAVVAWSTFRSQNGTPRSDHFGRWDVKKCTPLWRGAHLEVNMWKAHHLRTTFGRSTAPHLTTVQLQQRLITTATTTTTTTATSTTTLQLQLQPQLQLQWRLQLTLQFLKTLHYTTLYTLHFLHYIAARGLVKIPKAWGPGPLKFLFFKCRQISATTGRGSLKFLAHS